jgi:hypothetical protein
MNIDYYLPAPTEEELNLGNKSDYFERIIDLRLDKKYNITSKDLNFWVSHNFNSIFLTEKELSLTAIKKLM